ncbi:LOW QUALITY PROTEIN: hypothetical protein Cgig2_001985 [Carnegiea gigantea]|uniref:Ubiquitin-like protease family profile domain-containing protein n=1 Tax=Carnegiea gigantea TaxID=171969 RepID=A0A9Q1K1L0_9CARY|nr:LOW QUALITY PROTEIN: hypothetical protein Cgig2_001985 [Carnegiea gigantea]
MAVEDANSVPQPLTPFLDEDAVMVEQPPIAGDGGHCVADMSTSTITHGGDEQSCPRPSNIVSMMKQVPRLRKPSRGRGSAYTNPMRWTKDGRKGLKSTATVKTGSRHHSRSTAHGDVVNDEDVISVVPIAVVPGEGEVDAHEVPDVALKVRFAVRNSLPADDVPDTSTFGPSPHVPALRTRRRLKICNLQGGCKSVPDMDVFPYGVGPTRSYSCSVQGRQGQSVNFDMPEASEKYANAEFLKGLINVVPTWGAADRLGRVVRSPPVLQTTPSPQRNHKRYCRMSVFLDRHDQLLLVADVNNRRFITYDSLQCKWDGPRKRLLLSGVSYPPSYVITLMCMLLSLTSVQLPLQKVAIGLALMKLAEFTDVLRWEMEHANCPQQDNGHDCGVYMLMFMDLLSIRADGLYFGQPYVRQARDKLLLSLL